MDGDILALTMRHVLNQRNTLTAVLTGDRRLALSTFMADPLMARLTVAEGEALFRRMLDAQRPYVPEAFR